MELDPSFPTLPRRRRPQRRRIASCLEYDGTAFHGFQRQPNQRTVEGELVRCLQEVVLTGGLSFASRTDSGVHAIGQVICFRADANAEPPLLQQDLQSRLPPDIRIRTLTVAPPKFHPRWTAVGKRYRYSLRWGPPQARAWMLDAPLDRALLDSAGDELRAASDLRGFTAAGAPDKPGPPLSALRVLEQPDGLDLEFEGPAFGRYAIRHMVGCLVAQARGDVPAGTCARLAPLAVPYRGLRAPANGLVLEQVFYPTELDPFRDYR